MSPSPDAVAKELLPESNDSEADSKSEPSLRHRFGALSVALALVPLFIASDIHGAQTLLFCIRVALYWLIPASLWVRVDVLVQTLLYVVVDTSAGVLAVTAGPDGPLARATSIPPMLLLTAVLLAAVSGVVSFHLAAATFPNPNPDSDVGGDPEPLSQATTTLPPLVKTLAASLPVLATFCFINVLPDPIGLFSARGFARALFSAPLLAYTVGPVLRTPSPTRRAYFLLCARLALLCMAIQLDPATDSDVPEGILVGLLLFEFVLAGFANAPLPAVIVPDMEDDIEAQLHAVRHLDHRERREAMQVVVGLATFVCTIAWVCLVILVKGIHPVGPPAISGPPTSSGVGSSGFLLSATAAASTL